MTTIPSSWWCAVSSAPAACCTRPVEELCKDDSAFKAYWWERSGDDNDILSHAVTVDCCWDGRTIADIGRRTSDLLSCIVEGTLNCKQIQHINNSISWYLRGCPFISGPLINNFILVQVIRYCLIYVISIIKWLLNDITIMIGWLQTQLKYFVTIPFTSS